MEKSNENIFAIASKEREIAKTIYLVCQTFEQVCNDLIDKSALLTKKG